MLHARGSRITCHLIVIACATPAFGQDPGPSAPASRSDAIAAARAEKVAELWPEKQSGVVDMVDRWIERGFKEGLDSGKGANGVQFVLGGMRAAQGMSGGIGYRRSDLFRERLGYRGTVRGTFQGAYMLDFELDFSGLRTERTSVRWYSKFEHSPAIDYFGAGNDSSESDRSSFHYNDASSDFDAEYRPLRSLRVGLTGGYFHAHTAPSGEDGVPPIEEAFRPAALFGFGDDTSYTRLGFFGYIDRRDSRSGPRSGGLYGARYREYWDVARHQFAFRQVEFEAQHYVPYFNKGQVLAMRGGVVLSYPKERNAVPFYIQPTLGGNDELRGFAPYRFRDYHSLSLGVEHRWHAFSLLEMAAFGDAGKVVRLKREIDMTGLHYTAGLGFRFRIRSAVVTRFDIARSNEGFRMIFTFSDAFEPRR